MVKIEALIQPVKLDAVKEALDGLGIERIVYCHVMEHAGAQGLKTSYRGAEYSVDTPRVKMEMLVSSLRIDEVIEAVTEIVRTGAADDSMIVISEVMDALRIPG